MGEDPKASESVDALTFIADPTHEDYLPPGDLKEIAMMVSRARGQRGTNLDYLRNTVETLHQLELKDSDWKQYSTWQQEKQTFICQNENLPESQAIILCSDHSRYVFRWYPARVSTPRRGVAHGCFL